MSTVLYSTVQAKHRYRHGIVPDAPQGQGCALTSPRWRFHVSRGATSFGTNTSYIATKPKHTKHTHITRGCVYTP